MSFEKYHFIDLKQNNNMFNGFQNISRDGWLTMLGVSLIKISTGVISCWGSINLYILSYFYHEGRQITQQTNSIILLLTIIPIAFVMLLATKISDKFGYEKVIKICGIIFFLSPMAVHIQFNLKILNIFCIFLPISAYAISTIPLINCLWTQFPKAKNKATAIAVVCFGLGGIMWNYLFTLTVNPYNQSANIVDQKTGMSFFSTSVSDKIIFSIKFGYSLCGSMFVIGTFLVKKNMGYQDSLKSSDIQMSNMEQTKSPIDQINVGQLLLPDKNKNNIKESLTLKKALINNRFILIFLVSFLSGVYQVFINMNLKIIYMPIINDDRFLVYCAMTASAVSIIGAFFWGYIADKHGFYQTLIVFVVLDFFVKLYGAFSLSKISILFLFIFIGFTDKAMLTIMGPGLVKIFGIQIATELLPYKGFSVFLSYLAAPVGYILLSQVLSPFKYLLFMVSYSIIAALLAFKLYGFRKQKQK